MTSWPSTLPNFEVQTEGGNHARKFEVQVDLSQYDGERDELVHEARTLERALRDVAEGVDYVFKYGNVDDNPAVRGRRFVRAVYDHPAVVEAQYRPPGEVWLSTTTMDTDLWGELAMFAGLEEYWWRLDHDRDHGIVLDLEYRIRPFAVPAPDDAWADARERFHDEDPHPASDTERAADLRDEYDGEKEVVRNPAIKDGSPRLAGTGVLAYHVYYLDKTNDDLQEAVNRIYPTLDERDVAVAMEYAREHQEEAEQYVEEQVAGNERLRELLGTGQTEDE